MPITAQEIYSQVVRTLSPSERLRLANLILNDLVQQNALAVARSDTGTDTRSTRSIAILIDL